MELDTAFRGPGHWQSSRMAALLHTGSHVDAPLHVIRDGPAIDRVRLEDVIGDAVIVDLSDVGEREEINMERLSAAAGDRLRPGDIAVLRTDWTDRAWGTFPDYYTRSPYLTEDAASWLAERGPKAVVVDFFEEECAVRTDFSSEDFVVHRALLGNGIPIVEQATNLAATVTERFLLHAPFSLLGDVEAAPCRIYGVLPE